MSTSTQGLEDDFKLLGTRLAGRIVIDSVVARGGFGLVYRGRHEELGVLVAVKLLLAFSQYSARVREEFSARFMREARLIAKLRHPATVRLVDHGVDCMPNGETSPWMALEWLDGSPLSEQLRAREGRPYAITEALGLLRPAIEALAEAHAQGIAHRDVTPGNVFVCESGAPTRLIDFGIAREMEEDAEPGMGFTATRSTIHAFTMRYAAPEQVSQARTGPWTDVHSVGLMLTQMLTGVVPYPGVDETERVAQVLSARRPTPAAFGVDVGAIEAVIARCVAVRPADRYPNASALIEAIEAIGAIGAIGASGSVALAPPLASATQPFTLPFARGRTARDPRVVVGLITAALFVLGAIVAVFVPSAPGRSHPLVASVPRSQAALDVSVPTAVTQRLASPESAVNEAVGGIDAGRRRRALIRHDARATPAALPRALPRAQDPSELPRCTSYHQRNCRP